VPPAATGPDTILVSLAVPDSYFRSAVQAAVARDPAGDATAIHRRERERLVEHVRGLLPPTPDPTDCRVVVTEFATTPSRGSRTVATVTLPAAAPAASGTAGAVAQAVRSPAVSQPRTPGQILDATCQAVGRGEMAAVPREAWVVVIVVSGAVLAWMLLAAAVAPRPTGRPRRRGQPRIDWNAIDARDDEEAALARKVAA
jgi:hypothetical protein